MVLDPASMTTAELAAAIDHTLLKADATPAQIDQLCAEAREYQFKAVCVNPIYVPLASQRLAGSTVGVCTVVGFPLGATLTQAKARETELVVAAGAVEVDMVLAIGLLKAGHLDGVRDDVTAVVRAAAGKTVKVIIETALLTPEEITIASRISADGGAHFVKTSTGFSSRGASVEDLQRMRAAVPGHVQLKASGGIRDLATAKAMLAAGADRIGASASVAIVRDHQK